MVFHVSLERSLSASQIYHSLYHTLDLPMEILTSAESTVECLVPLQLS